MSTSSTTKRNGMATTTHRMPATVLQGQLAAQKHVAEITNQCLQAAPQILATVASIAVQTGAAVSYSETITISDTKG